MANYPLYKLNIIYADDPKNKISDKATAPTTDPATAPRIEQEARDAVRSGAGEVVIINGSHTQLLRAGNVKIDAFLSHNDEVGDNFPIINLVLRG